MITARSTPQEDLSTLMAARQQRGAPAGQNDSRSDSDHGPGRAEYRAALDAVLAKYGDEKRFAAALQGDTAPGATAQTQPAAAQAAPVVDGAVPHVASQPAVASLPEAVSPVAQAPVVQPAPSAQMAGRPAPTEVPPTAVSGVVPPSGAAPVVAPSLPSPETVQMADITPPAPSRFSLTSPAAAATLNPWDNDPIVSEASPAAPWEADPIEESEGVGPIGEAIGYTARGVTRGLGQALGAPVDLANAAISTGMTALDGYQDVAERISERLGVPFERRPTPKVSENPVGGSNQIVGLAADAGLTERSIKDVPEAYRPFAVAGETVGASVPFAAAPLAAARAAGTRAATGITAPVVNAARTAPGLFASAEAGAALGAGQGAAIAEAVAPGEAGPRMIGEVAGGLANPAGLVVRASKNVTDSLRRAAASFTESGRESAAAERVQTLVREGGDDPAALAKTLRESSAIDAPMTPGQRTGNETLLALERALIKEAPTFGPQVEKQTRESIAAANEALLRATDPGNPEAFRQVGVAREEWFKALIAQRLDFARQKGERAVSRLTGQSSRNRPAANLRARELLESAIGDAREQERVLWRRVDHDLPVEAKGVLDSYNSVRSELLDEESLPAPIEAFLSRVRQSIEPLPGRNAEPPTVSTGDLFRFRSRVLAMARDARSKGENALNRHLMILADGALDDLDTLVGDRAQAARSFSRALNQQLNQGYPAQVLGVDSRGAARVPAEITLDKGIAGGGPVADVRGRELERAVTPVPGGPGLTAARGGDASARPAEMRKAQEDVLRDVAGSVVNPTTGRINADSLSKWVSNNDTVLDRFPNLRADLASAESAERALANVEGVVKRATNAVKQAAFSKVAKIEDPRLAVRNALKSPTPAREFAALARLASRGGDDAKAGLRASLMDHLFDQATQSGMVSGSKLRDSLFQPMSPGQPSIMRVATDSGVMSADQIKRLDRVIREVERFEKALASTSRIDEVIDQPSAFADLIARVVGANVGGAGVVGQTSGAPIVAAGAGSRFARDLLNKVPNSRLRDVLMKGVENPEFMAALLSKELSRRQKKLLERQINAFALQAGLVEKDEER